MQSDKEKYDEIELDILIPTDKSKFDLEVIRKVKFESIKENKNILQ
jgi:hypothetical protein